MGKTHPFSLFPSYSGFPFLVGSLLFEGSCVREAFGFALRSVGRGSIQLIDLCFTRRKNKRATGFSSGNRRRSTETECRTIVRGEDWQSRERRRRGIGSRSGAGWTSQTREVGVASVQVVHNMDIGRGENVVVRVQQVLNERSEVVIPARFNQVAESIG